jgi:hypothetical protein
MKKKQKKKKSLKYELKQDSNFIQYIIELALYLFICMTNKSLTMGASDDSSMTSRLAKRVDQA